MKFIFIFVVLLHYENIKEIRSFSLPQATSVASGEAFESGRSFFMKEIQLTKGQVALVDDEDFDYLNQWKWYAMKPSKDKNGIWYYYAVRSEWIKGGNKNRIISMHRILMKADKPSILVDHKDKNTLNNQKSNLRVCTKSQNCSNQQKIKGTTSKYLGVCRHGKDKWQVGIAIKGKRKYIGLFSVEEEAALAYNKKAIEIHGEFASLNVLPEPKREIV